MLVSVIIVSRDREDWLGLTLRSLTFQTYAPFEVIVVGDDAAERAVAASGLSDQIVFVPFGPANISAARNAGLAQALGQVAAFIDDDAVAEPMWLARLVEPFADPRVGVAGGFVRGPNGISFQWRGETVSPTALHQPLALAEDAITLRGIQNGQAPEVMGTNCAYRTAPLCDIGGFDPVFRYLLDESDVNLRMAQAGHLTAFVPQAQVHHKLAASAQRRADKAPHSLTTAGRSLAAFLVKHARSADHRAAIAQHRQRHRVRLLHLMRAGHLLPGQVTRLLAGFDAALAETVADPQPLPPIQPVRSRTRLFRSDPPTLRATTLVAKGPSPAGRALARAAAADGQITTLFELSPTTLFHRVSFQPEGYWLHRGGVFGKSDRDGSLVQAWSRMGRVRHEAEKRAAQRPFGPPRMFWR